MQVSKAETNETRTRKSWHLLTPQSTAAAAVTRRISNDLCISELEFRSVKISSYYRFYTVSYI